VNFSAKFVAAVKVAAQLLPVTSALAQWLSEIETSRMVERLERLEDPLARYGPRVHELSQTLYSLIRGQQQDVPTTHLDWTPELKPFIKELRHLEADGLLVGSHALGLGGEFRAGFRLNPGFIVYLALLHAESEESEKLIQILDDAKHPLNGVDVKKSVNLPLTVIDSYFEEYENRGQGFKSNTIGSSLYLPKGDPPS
jgi:hypothetical protein